MVRHGLLFLLTVFLSFGISCTTSQGTPSSGNNPPAITLEKTTWILQSYGQPTNLKTPLKEAEITAIFDDVKSQVTGSAGVNQYFGPYKREANKLVITGPLGSTKMSGPQPLMNQENEYLATLQMSEMYKIDSDKLTITCGNKTLVFTKK